MTSARTSGLRRLARRSLFMVLPILGLASPFLAYPTIAAHFGADGVAAISVGQGLGILAATISEVGWGLIGPRLAAQASLVKIRHLVDLSLGACLASYIVTTLLATPAVLLASPTYKAAAVVSLASTAANGVSLSWFFIG